MKKAAGLCVKKNAPLRRASPRVRSGFRQWANQRSTPSSAALARLAATANINPGRETVLSSPNTSNVGGFTIVHEQKSRFSLREM